MTSDVKKLLEVLQLTPGEWVGNLYRLKVMVHSRISDIRKMGHKVECKKYGRSDYRYRLVPKTTEAAQ